MANIIKDIMLKEYVASCNTSTSSLFLLFFVCEVWSQLLDWIDIVCHYYYYTIPITSNCDMWVS